MCDDGCNEGLPQQAFSSGGEAGYYACAAAVFVPCVLCAFCVHCVLLAWCVWCGADWLLVCAEEDALQLDDTLDESKEEEEQEEEQDDSKEVDGLLHQLAADSGAQAGMQDQLAACLASTGVIVALKKKNKELAEALAAKNRQLADSEQANIELHGVQLDKLKAEAKLKDKTAEVKDLKLQLATLRRKASTYANGILGAWPVACTLLRMLASRA
jgi:hypothetical protein